jgi:two-component sensor histidine kinase
MLDDLRIQQANHRSSNDLQMIVSLLSLQRQTSPNSDVRDALTTAINRVRIVADARAALYRCRGRSIVTALGLVFEALQGLADSRSIVLELRADCDDVDLPDALITTLALAANELVTNALRHSFPTAAGHIQIDVTIDPTPEANILCILVSDNGSVPVGTDQREDQLGFRLVQRLMRSLSGSLVISPEEAKCPQLRIPLLPAPNTTDDGNRLR